MAPMPRRALSILAAVTALVVAGCGSSGHTQTGTATSSTDMTPSTTAAPPAPPAPSAGAAPVSGPVPAVANATDLKSKPQVSAGIPPKPTQLVAKDLVVGTGQVAIASSTVSVQYLGANFDDGKEFDSSWARGAQPVDFPLSGVIPGFAQGIVGMKVGGRRELVIPPDLGYGPNGSPPAVGPNETLVFIIDLVAVK
jgi:peptidylprolyl isomerase